MKILAFDASAATGAVAITDGTRPICAFSTPGARTHSETLLPLAHKALTHAGIDLSDINLFACSVGPGSFTGVRIAVSLVKGLAFGSGKPCVGVSSLEVLAYNLHDADGIICPVIDARRGNVYNALFRAGERLSADRLISAEALEQELSQYQENIYLVGDAYDWLTERMRLPLAQTPPEKQEINGFSVAFAALERYQRDGAGHTDAALRPEYLRPSQAERERKERENHG